MIADTHCHLYLDEFHNDIDRVLNQAWDAGVDRILVPGIDAQSSRQAIQLAEIHQNIYAAVGTHPNSATSWTVRSIDEMMELTTHPKVVAIGEIGLDYYRDRTPTTVQKASLIDQLDLAAEKKLPIILHCRHAFNDLYEIIKSWLIKNSTSFDENKVGVFHSFEGTSEQALSVIGHKFLIGINGASTFPKAEDRRKVIKAIRVEDMLLETDAPFLAPQPYRGKRNEPGYLPIILDLAAKLKELPSNEIAAVTSYNANELFRWGENQ